MKITGKKLSHIASPGWQFHCYLYYKKHTPHVRHSKSYSKHTRNFVKKETSRMIAEAC